MKQTRANLFNPQSIFNFRFKWNGLTAVGLIFLGTLLWLIPMEKGFEPARHLSHSFDAGQLQSDLTEEMMITIRQQDTERYGLTPNGESIEIKAPEMTLVINPETEQMDKLIEANTNLLLLMPESYLYKVNGERYTANYQFVFSEGTVSRALFSQQLQESYLVEQMNNQRLIFRMSRHLVFVLIFFSFSFLMASFLKAKQRQNGWDIYNFWQAYNMVVLAMIVPTLIAFGFGFLQPSPLKMFAIQGMGTLLNLYLSFNKTHFKEMHK